MRIRVIWEGKTRNAHLKALAADYQERIERLADIVIEEISPARGAARGVKGKLAQGERRLLEKLHASAKVLLDPRGSQWTSEEFAQWLGQQAVRGRREVAFVAGGPDGFSEAFRAEADHLLALSRMTLTHEWARVLLLEQIYRGFTILRGFPYPR
jgi:23S rRNA (pseudouridine1915-N3)-methyltransferase